MNSQWMMLMEDPGFPTKVTLFPYSFMTYASALPPARILPRAAGKLETRFPRHVQTDLRHPLRAE